jgi:hypothetical protein
MIKNEKIRKTESKTKSMKGTTKANTTVKRSQSKPKPMIASPLSAKPSLRPYGLGGGVWQHHEPRPKDYVVGIPVDPAQPAATLSLEGCQKLCVLPCWRVTFHIEDFVWQAKGTAWHAHVYATVKNLIYSLGANLAFTHYTRGEPFIAPALSPQPFVKKRFEQLLRDTLFFNADYENPWLFVRNGAADAAAYDTSLLVSAYDVELCLAPGAIEGPALVKRLTDALKDVDFAYARVCTGLSGWFSVAALRHPTISVASKVLAALEHGCPGLAEEAALFIGPRRLFTVRGKKLLSDMPASINVTRLGEEHALITPESSPKPSPDGRFESSASAKALFMMVGEWLRKLKPTSREMDAVYKAIQRLPKVKW